MKRVALCLIIALAGGILTSCGKVQEDVAEINIMEETVESTIETEVVTETEKETEETTKGYEPPEYNYKSGLCLQAKEYREETGNEEVIGWVRLAEELEVDRPLMRGTDNDFYLSHGEDKASKSGGSIFADWRCIWGYQNDTDCLIIYGHNMPDGSVFGKLKSYREIEDFYKEHKTFEVSSINHDALYEIVAAVKSGAKKENNYDWWNQLRFTTKRQFAEWKEYISENNMLKSEEVTEEIQQGDNVCILCTCYSTVDDIYRYVLIAKQIA